MATMNRDFSARDRVFAIGDQLLPQRTDCCHRGPILSQEGPIFHTRDQFLRQLVEIKLEINFSIIWSMADSVPLKYINLLV